MFSRYGVSLSLMVFGLFALLHLGCTDDAVQRTGSCSDNSDCATDEVCLEGQCAAGDRDTGLTPTDAGTDIGQNGDDAGGDMGGGEGDAGTDTGTGDMAPGEDAGPDADLGSGTDTGNDTGNDVGTGVTYLLSISIVGTGSGTVDVTYGSTMLTCSATATMCDYDVPAGSSVVLAPTADAGSEACPWLSPPTCTGTTGDCSFVMNSDMDAFIQFKSESGGPGVCLQ